MSREDLPKGYDGWQVLDPTPQERSDGTHKGVLTTCPLRALRENKSSVDLSMYACNVNECNVVNCSSLLLHIGIYCCGPCPVQAVRGGDVGMKYDAAFVFSEVNADLICWIVHSDGEKTRASLDSKVVGRNISTKSVYGDYREDITANYKYPEGIDI